MGDNTGTRARMMTYINEQVTVDADHVHPDYWFRDTIVKTFGMDDGWYATHPKLGCSKTYPTQRDAVRGLFADHACTNVKIYR